MGFLSGFRTSRPRRRGGSAFPAADISRLTSSWTTDPGAVNRWLRYELRTLRARSRQLARGDAYGAKFVRACVDNIAGPSPFTLQAKFRFSDGRLNAKANAAVEEAWCDRGHPGLYEVTGKLSREEFIRLEIRCLARDGEYLVREVSGGRFGRGMLQLIDIDRLDEQRNENLANGNTIKLGVELDPFSRPVAYHLLKQHPGELGEWSRGMAREHERVPADQIRHRFIADWPEQVRGFPWMHAAMVRLWHLGGFEEAAVINARIGASKVATIEAREGEDPGALATHATGKDTAGNFLTDTEPGQYWALPPGTTLGGFDPAFPDASVEPFIRACLRGIGAGVNMSYHSIGNDPGAVNYSTAQVFRMDEADYWKGLQNWYIEHDCLPDFGNWLRQEILVATFPPAYWKQRYAVRFQPKTWAHVDEKKSAEARLARLNAQLTSRTRIAAEQGEDFEDILDELAAEQELAKAKGITLTAEAPQEKPANGSEPEPANPDQPGQSGAAD